MGDTDQKIEYKDCTKLLAQYTADFSYTDMPPDVLTRAKTVLLDTLGSILPATDPIYPGSKALINLVRVLGGEPQSSIIGFDIKTSSINACLVNGTFGYAYDIEPHHVAAVLHPAAVCIPVALAFSEWKRKNGKDLLAALTLGIEISCRVSMALNPRDLYGRGFHPTAIACTFGAAATAGHLLQLNTAQWLNALGLSGNQASGLLAWAKDPTENSRPFNPGIAAAVQELLDLADNLYQRAEWGIAQLPARVRPGIFAARTIYAEIGRKVEANGLDSVSQRAVVNRRRKIHLLIGAVRMALAEREEGFAPPLKETRFLVEACRSVQ